MCAGVCVLCVRKRESKRAQANLCGGVGWVYRSQNVRVCRRQFVVLAKVRENASERESVSACWMGVLVKQCVCLLR